MRAKANRVFLDVRENVLRCQGQVFELSAERFEEIDGKIPGALTALDCAAAAGPADVPAERAGGDETAGNAGSDGADERPDLDEMTCEQLREYIASKGGEAPSKAKRAELDAIARGL